MNRFFYPDHSATSQMLTDLAFHLAGCGVGVEVVASRQRYDDPRAALAKAERVGGVTIHRLSATRFGRAGLAGRGFDYLSYGASAYRRLLACTRPGDVLVVKTDPPLLAVAAMRAARRRGLYLVNWLQDLYPEIAAELGVPLAGGRFGRVLLDRRDAALRAADANVVVGEGMAARVRARGVAAERVRVIPNWCDDEEIQPVAPVANPLRREWGLDHHFVVGYSGNLGRAHEIATMLAAAERLRGDQRFKFLFIGGGNGFRDLAAEVRDRRLGHLFAFFPYQDRSRLKFSLGVADVHLISLRPELEGLIVPSKLYGIAAAGRSIVAIAAADGDVARFVQRAGCGVVIAPGAGELLAEALRRLRADPGCVAEMGRRARAALDADFTRRQAFARWRGLIEEITAAPPLP